MSNIFHLVYASTASEDCNNQVIISILEAARVNNKKADLTGILIYRQERFMQLIEGDEEVVLKLYKKIMRDKRHHDMRIILAAKSEERIYKDWDMAYVDSRQVNDSAIAIFEFFDRVMFYQKKYDKALILPFLKKFLGEKIVF